MKKDQSEEICKLFKGVPPKNIIIAIDDLPPKSLEQHIKEQQTQTHT